MKEDDGRKIFDCHDCVAVAYKGFGHNQGKVHIFPVPRAGTALSLGVRVEGHNALQELIAACQEAMHK